MIYMLTLRSIDFSNTVCYTAYAMSKTTIVSEGKPSKLSQFKIYYEAIPANR